MRKGQCGECFPTDVMEANVRRSGGVPLSVAVGARGGVLCKVAIVKMPGWLVVSRALDQRVIHFT